MDLSFAKTPRFATSVLLTWLFEDEDDDEYENDTLPDGQELIPSVGAAP
jgi:hypothetical protein